MKHPHPPVSDGENKNDVEGMFSPEQNQRIKAILTASASEAPSDPTSVGVRHSFSQYNPHNYRLYFDYIRNEMAIVKGSVGGRFVLLGSRNHNSEIVFQHKSGHTVTIKKTQAEVRKKHQERDWALIDNADPDQIDIIVQRMKKEATQVFYEFVEDYGGKTKFTILNEYSIDNALKNTLTEKQPMKVQFETHIVKKLYNEKKLEYKNVVAAKNAAHNAGLYDFSTVLGSQLESMSAGIVRLEEKLSTVSTSPQTLVQPTLIAVEEIIVRITKPGDFQELKAHYDLLDWDDRFKVCEHIGKMLERDTERLRETL